MPHAAWLPLIFRNPGAALAGDGVLGLVSEALGVDVDRRGFGSLAAGAAAGLVLPEVSIPPQVNASHIRYLEACAGTLRSQDRKVGGIPLSPLGTAGIMFRRSSCTLRPSSGQTPPESRFSPRAC